MNDNRQICPECDSASVLAMNLYVSQHVNSCTVLYALTKSSRKMHPLPGSVKRKKRKKNVELHAHADSAVFVSANPDCS